jgi:hypothetical protein
MSLNGVFEIEEADIVRLDADEHKIERDGWVNVGAFAINICLGSYGELTVAVHARTQEGDPLQTLTVTAQSAAEKGGIDPDQTANVCGSCGTEIPNVIGTPEGVECCEECRAAGQH